MLRALSSSMMAGPSHRAASAMGISPGAGVFSLQIREATKKAGGTVKNKGGSPGQRLGLKKWDDQPVVPGNIIVRQRGKRYWEGENVGVGKDFTLFALKEGRVRFESVIRSNGKRKTIVHVEPKYLSEKCMRFEWVG